jgi:D-glycero-alpha-D-manno-heptose 1-phosphate guanylyltransferase
MVSKNNTAISQAVILAGGFGTRLRSVVSDRPKSLAEVSGKPFIEYQLDWLMKQGITDVTLATHHMGDQIKSFVEHWSNDSLNVDYVHEEEPLGTGGAVANAVKQKKLHGKILVINGDTLFRFSLAPVMRFLQPMIEPALMIASIQEDVSRFGTITVDNNYVRSFRQATGQHKPGLVNGGAYLMDCDSFVTTTIKPFSLEHDYFPRLVSKNKLLVYVVDESEGFYDIGTPDAYKQICTENSSEC